MKRPILPVPAANAAILKNGKILLTRRSAQIREGGKWCLPGGHVELGEKWVTAMTREVFEETGLIVKKSCLLGMYSDPELTVTPTPYYGAFHGQFVVATFMVTEFEGELNPNHEVDAWGWFGFNEIPTPMLRSHTIRVHDALNFKGVPFVR
ncbi:MAG: NUDIX domain-containing protein [Pseudomonadota bacterium]